MSYFTLMRGNETTAESSETDSEIDIPVNQLVQLVPHTHNSPTLEKTTVIDFDVQMFAENYSDQTSQIELDVETPTTDEWNDKDAVLHNKLPSEKSLMSKLAAWKIENHIERY
ncbi:hypothetical protein DAPPUDRAFT_323867 [Daphnia pulex]|uniref:Uncharacterized protein n=1 Tax=Daphnia pulex TaxID=6669 RepID=E9H004_DAPPU|nr:hypothetical protein DAPPUDRAFT_323867 [Daphnia pulex]|eukprot:EFX74910.1 hypothetical protein DAPPUDRAFT_323867 [Daphnia pulex]